MGLSKARARKQRAAILALGVLMVPLGGGCESDAGDASSVDGGSAADAMAMPDEQPQRDAGASDAALETPPVDASATDAGDDSKVDSGGNDADGGSSDLPVIGAPASLLDATAGSAIDPVTFTASSPSTVTWSVTAGALPDGLTLDSATGVYSGTPTATGDFTFTVTATNAAGSASLELTHQVVAPDFDANLLLSGNRLVAFSTGFPSHQSDPLDVTGLDTGDTLVAIDRRPVNGLLYGLAINDTDEATIYLISPTGRANMVGPHQRFLDGSGDTVLLSPSAQWGFDFNPVVDRARVTSSTGRNFRMNPNDGTAIDGNTVANNVNPDGAIQGATTRVDEVAYTNNRMDGGTTTTLYSVDADSDALYIQNAPNSGTQGSKVALSIAVDAVLGFDMGAGVDAAQSGEAVASGEALAIVRTAGSSDAQLARLSLTEGDLTGLVSLGLSDVRGFAVQKQPSVPMLALSADGLSLLRFYSSSPGNVDTRTVSGVVDGETLVGIEYRPWYGQLLALGINAGADTGTLYRMDPLSGALTIQGSASQIAFVNEGGGTTDLPPAASGYGISFDGERLGVVTSTGLNFRVRPDTGGPVDDDSSAPGITPSTPQSGPASDATGAAFTNAFAGAEATTRYALSVSTQSLHRLDFGGVHATGLPILLNGSPLSFGALNGFAIQTHVRTLTYQAPVTQGIGYAVLTASGTTKVYAIDLTTAALSDLGTLDDGTTAVCTLVAGETRVL